MHVIGEFLHGLLHFDTKAWRTLPMVIFRPGTLTRNYVYGKRARYISPLTLFLLCDLLHVLRVLDRPQRRWTSRDSRAAACAAVEELAEAREELAQAQSANCSEERADPDPG